MKVKATFLWLVFILAVVANLVEAGLTIFDSNATISDGDNYEDVVVEGEGTIVNILGGNLNNLMVLDSSTVNIYGSHTFRIQAYDTSQVNTYADMSGEMICLFGQSTMRIHNGNINGVVFLQDSSVLNIIDGTIGWVLAQDRSTCSIAGGSVIDCDGSARAVINMTGGNVVRMAISVESSANISGGALGGLAKFIQPTSEVDNAQSKAHIFGRNLRARPYSGQDIQIGQVTGEWADGSPFTIPLVTETFAPSKGVYSHIVLHEGETLVSCTNPPESDVNDDCRVDIMDFTAMATEWLVSGVEGETGN